MYNNILQSNGVIYIQQRWEVKRNRIYEASYILIHFPSHFVYYIIYYFNLHID